MPLQKSFSEQHQGNRQRQQQWHRSKSHSAAQAPAPQPVPLPPVSLKTKSKLKAFAFKRIDQETADTDTSCPGHGKARGEADASSDKENAHGQAGQSKSRPTLDGLESNAVTPLAKVGWQDLMGLSEAKHKVDEASPSETLGWQAHDPSCLPAASPMVLCRGRKRARSSSPLCSPHSSPITAAVNVKGLAKALRTPHADPALDLWDKFSGPGVDKPSPSGLANPLLQLMVPSSPHPSRDGSLPSAKRERSLIRAISHDSTWSKRRKVRHGNAGPSAEEGGPDAKVKTSMVMDLMETVEVEISKTRLSEAEDEAMTFRSPSPVKISREQPRRHAPGGSGPGPGPGPAGESEESPATVGRASEDDGVADSDYGDLDMDDDTLLELDAQVLDAAGEEVTLVGDDSAEGQPRATHADKAGLDDEFGDDDLFDGVEAMLSNVESMHSRPAAKAKDFSDDDEYGDAFGVDFDCDASERAATQAQAQATLSLSASARVATSSLSNPSQKAKSIQRYLVKQVLECTYAGADGVEYGEKILAVEAERTKAIKTVHLRQDWFDTPVSVKGGVKAYVHVLGEFDAAGMCVVDNDHNLIILHPDQLISSTVLADSFSCMRRAVLQDRVKATSDTSAALVYGTLLHEIFQAALLANRWDAAFLASVVDKTLAAHLEDVFVIDVSLNEAKDQLLAKMAEVRSWAATFVSHVPRAEAVVQGTKNERVTMCVSKLLDVEEHVWSPRYGLKGNIDATVQVSMRGSASGQQTLTVPFELKTGKRAGYHHRTQTMLYNLLLSDRYDIDIYYGILYYMETSETVRVAAPRHELRPIIMKRNELACYIRERTVQLPAMLRQKHACGRCYAQSACFTYHRLADDGDGHTSDMGSTFDDAVQHLTPQHKHFFLQWEDLLTEEEKETQKLRRELWTMVSTERERVGRCFANVVIQHGSAREDAPTSKINRFAYTLVKEKPAAGFSFVDSQLTAGEPIVVSDEEGHFALALGYVTAVRKRAIDVAVDRRLHQARARQPGFDAVDRQVFASIMSVTGEAEVDGPRVRYRLDKDEFSSGMATVRNNLVQVMADGPPGSRAMRELVVELRAPRFGPSPPSPPDLDDGLNVDQRRAIDKVMRAQDYALVLGMPGTGKTTTIAHLIGALVKQGKSVLLASYTHTAVDNILLKLRGPQAPPVLRLGAAAKVHPEVRDFATLAAEPKHSLDEVRRAWHDTPVVATTCLGVNHAVLSARRFDYCIVDEASQITLPVCLGPIRCARTFVLVGDHNQLPPLVQNEKARRGGLDVSLFKRLSDAHPHSVATLEHQYRMCEDIMALSNTLIYRGRLKCATEALRHRSLHVPHLDRGLRTHHFDAATFLSQSQSQSQPCPPSFCQGGAAGPCWLRDLLHPSARAVFVNTDRLPDAREQARGCRIVNPCEARIVAQLAEALLACGVPPRDVGVMTHYRSQLAVLRHALRRCGGAADHIEMHTADRFQGRDKDVVLISLVRSNAERNIGDLLRDWRRINVAFTRAKTKLLVIGSRDTLRGGGGGAGGSAGAGDDDAMRKDRVRPRDRDRDRDGEGEGDKDKDKDKDGNGNGNGNPNDEPDAKEMLARFVALMEQRDGIYDLPPDALDAHYFPDDGGATQASTTASATAASPSPGKTKNNKKAGPLSSSPRKSQQQQQHRLPQKPGPKRVGRSEDMLLKGRVFLGDILNEVRG